MKLRLTQVFKCKQFGRFKVMFDYLLTKCRLVHLDRLWKLNPTMRWYCQQYSGQSAE